MIKRPTPKKLSVEEQEMITKASLQQTGKSSVDKSYDPNYPVFEIPVNQKVLVYIPNHTVTTEDGGIAMRMDSIVAHPVIDGRSFADIRCIADSHVASLGHDGSCPLCDAIGTAWSLYSKQYADVARSKGIAVDAPEAQELLKSDRTELAKQRVVKEGDRWYIFPIVVIECEEGSLTPKKDAQGQIHGTPMWYQIREQTYIDKWVTGLDTVETPEGGTPTSPAGLWAVLNFTYTPKSGTHNKRDSARNLKVMYKTMAEGYDAWATHFDGVTEGWDIAKADETLAICAVRDMGEMKELADTLLKPVNEKLAMYELASGGASTPSAPAIGGSSPESALANFGATPAAPSSPANPLAETANTGVE